MRVHESHNTGHAIIAIFFLEYTNSRYSKYLRLSRSVVFYAHVKGVSERSELTPCIILLLYAYMCTLLYDMFKF